MYEILLVCGGPSLERGISLNTTRSVYDNIGEIPGVNVEIIFIDLKMKKYKISQQFLYSNTPSDFDFKLKDEGEYLTDEQFEAELKASDLVFPVIHGQYGEDGKLQELLEKLGVNFVGSPSQACLHMYNKEKADRYLLREHGFYTVPKLVVFREMSLQEIIEKVTVFFAETLQDVTAEVVVKPVEGGSSIGVEKTGGLKGTVRTIAELFCRHDYKALIVELLCTGKEFTVIVLENKQGQPVALLPTEIECKGIFTQEKKYMPSERTHFYCPPRFSAEIVAQIRAKATHLFTLAGARDFLRIDGWVLASGQLYFSDFNPISGMEQNSFFFQQGARVGLTHQGLINYILQNASSRYGFTFPQKSSQVKSKEKIYILMGGWTSERQVSLMSGTNVWLKLLHSGKYTPTPFLLFKEEEEIMVLELPYGVALNHTVEEILYQYHDWQARQTAHEYFYKLAAEIRECLSIQQELLCTIAFKKAVPLKEFMQRAKEDQAFVFLGLHGGFGEDGSLQRLLEKHNLPFNGSGAIASWNCMDKYKTGQLVMELGLPGLRTARKRKITVAEMRQLVEGGKIEAYWRATLEQLQSDFVVIKPNADGCSTGVIVLRSAQDFAHYVQLIYNHEKYIEPHTFTDQPVIVALSSEKLDEYILEEYIPTERIRIENGELVYSKKPVWLEMTVGVLEEKGVYHSLNPSITIAEDAVLSVQEKFQGGIGVNITPPPEDIVAPAIVAKVKEAIEKTAEKLGIKDYSRIDIFVHLGSGEIIIIEANTLPGLSPSTVLFQQGVKEVQSLLPLCLLEKIINF